MRFQLGRLLSQFHTTTTKPTGRTSKVTAVVTASTVANSLCVYFVVVTTATISSHRLSTPISAFGLFGKSVLGSHRYYATATRGTPPLLPITTITSTTTIRTNPTGRIPTSFFVTKDLQHQQQVQEMSTDTTPPTPAVTSLDLSNKKGEFQRSDAKWRNWIQDTSKMSTEEAAQVKFPAEGNDRYHLYVSYACPWAHRTMMVHALMGLHTTIGLTIVHPIWRRTKPEDPNDIHTGWYFGQLSSSDAAADDTKGTMELPTLTNADGNGGPFPLSYPKNSIDPYGDAKTIREVYERAAKNSDHQQTGGVYSVPILYDTKTNTIVNNESSEIIRMLNSEFRAFSTYPIEKQIPDLYPQQLQSAIDEVNGWVYPNINNGVYRCGFAKTQIAYDEAITQLTAALDRVESILQKQRYIVAPGNQFTEADIRLFVTLLRYDEVYTVYFKCNTRCIEFDYPAILNYCRDIYQMYNGRIQSTICMEQIKVHYYCSHPKLNYYSIIPKGRDFMKLLQQPHNRNDV